MPDEDYSEGKWKMRGYEIVDGFHRIAAARKRGDSDILAYVPSEDD